MTKFQSLTMSVLGLGALVIGVVLAGMAVTSAQEGTTSPTPTPTATDDANTETTPPADDTDEDEQAEDCPGGLHGWRLVEDAAAEVLGLTEDDLHAAFEEGQTLADVAQAQGMSVDDFKSALTAAVTADLQVKLGAGDITQEQYDEALADLNDNLDDLVSSTPPARGHHGGAHFQALDAAADALGIDESDLHDALASGQTLAEIAEAQGISVDALASALSTSVTADLQEKLAAGDITQEQYDEATSTLADRIDDIINGEFSGHGPGRHHGFRGGVGDDFGGNGSDDKGATTGTTA
jgi:uncharacterized membrane protein